MGSAGHSCRAVTRSEIREQAESAGNGRGGERGQPCCEVWTRTPGNVPASGFQGHYKGHSQTKGAEGLSERIKRLELAQDLDDVGFFPEMALLLPSHKGPQTPGL